MFSQMCVCQQINTLQRETLPQMAASNNCSDLKHSSYFFFLISFPFEDNIYGYHVCFLQISAVFV